MDYSAIQIVKTRAIVRPVFRNQMCLLVISTLLISPTNNLLVSLAAIPILRASVQNVAKLRNELTATHAATNLMSSPPVLS